MCGYQQRSGPGAPHGPSHASVHKASHAERHTQHRSQHHSHRPPRPVVEAPTSLQQLFEEGALLSEAKFAALFNRHAGMFEDGKVDTYDQYVRQHRQHHLQVVVGRARQADRCWDAVAYPRSASADDAVVCYAYDADVFGPLPANGLPLTVEYPASLAPHGLDFGAGVVISNIPPTMSHDDLLSVLAIPADGGGAAGLDIGVGLPDGSKQYHRFCWLRCRSDNATASSTALLAAVSKPVEAAGLFCGPSSATYVHRARVSGIRHSCLPAFTEQVAAVLKHFERQGDNDEAKPGDLSLDAMLHRLRSKHHVCALCPVVAGCAEELVQRCGNLHLYKVITDSQEAAADDAHVPVADVQPLLDACEAFTSCAVGGEEEEESTMVDAVLMAEDVKCLEPEKWQCRLCEKLFRGGDFVLKHMHLKHPDEHVHVVRQRVRNLAAWQRFLPFFVALMPLSMVRRPVDGLEAAASDLQRPHRRRLPHFTARTYRDWDQVKKADDAIDYEL